MIDKLTTASLLTISVILFLNVGGQAKNPSKVLLDPYQTALRSIQQVGTSK